jgi:crotonobetainyl-CoA:carnitine CoA-transferase CaiB-like acyl-CoA transferase
MQILDDIRVVEWAEALAAPYCAMLLGDFGAEVVKVERPGTGDQSRAWGPPFVGTESAYYLSTNRNKRSITLNLNSPGGIEVLQRLVARADVFIHNQPARDSLVKRSLDYESVSASNPRIIYCAVSGYGWTGPKAGRPGYDILAQGEAGVMSFTGEPGGGPLRYPIAIADATCGMYAAMGVLAALLVRERSGKGQFLDMALLDAQLSWLINVGSSYLNAGELPKRHGNSHPNIVPYQLFRAADGKYMMIAVGTEALWKKFCMALEIESTLGSDPRFVDNRARIENRDALVDSLQRIFSARSREAWLEVLRRAEVPAGPVQTVDEALNDTHVLARHAIVEIEHPTLRVARSVANPIRMSATPIQYRYPPPLLGEHTSGILQELGYTAEKVSSLKSNGST